MHNKSGHKHSTFSKHIINLAQCCLACLMVLVTEKRWFSDSNQYTCGTITLFLIMKLLNNDCLFRLHGILCGGWGFPSTSTSSSYCIVALPQLKTTLCEASDNGKHCKSREIHNLHGRALTEAATLRFTRLKSDLAQKIQHRHLRPLCTTATSSKLRCSWEKWKLIPSAGKMTLCPGPITFYQQKHFEKSFRHLLDKALHIIW